MSTLEEEHVDEHVDEQEQEEHDTGLLKPKRKRNYTDEQRAVMRERMIEVNKKRVKEAHKRQAETLACRERMLAERLQKVTKERAAKEGVKEPTPKPKPKPKRSKQIKVINDDESGSDTSSSGSSGRGRIVIVNKRRTTKPAAPKERPEVDPRRVYFRFV